MKGEMEGRAQTGQAFRLITGNYFCIREDVMVAYRV